MADNTRSQTVLNEATLQQIDEMMKPKLQALTMTLSKMEAKWDKKFGEMLEMIHMWKKNRFLNPSHVSTDDLIAVLQTKWNTPETEKESSLAEVEEIVSDAEVPMGIATEVDNNVAYVEEGTTEIISEENVISVQKKVLEDSKLKAAKVEELITESLLGDIEDLNKVNVILVDTLLVVDHHLVEYIDKDLVRVELNCDSIFVEALDQFTPELKSTSSALLPNVCCLQDVRRNVPERLSFELPPAKPPDRVLINSGQEHIKYVVDSMYMKRGAGTSCWLLDLNEEGRRPQRCLWIEGFMVGGYTWAIYFYLDGKCTGDHASYVSLFIALAGEGTNVRVLFEILVSDQGDMERHKEIRTLGRGRESGPCTLRYRGSMWGYKQFFNGVQLESSDYLTDDSISITCTTGVVRSYTQESKIYSIGVPASNIGEHFETQLECENQIDIKFEIDGEIFAAHKLVFGPMTKRNLDGIYIEDIEPTVSKAMLHYMHWDSLPDMEKITGLNSKLASIIMSHHLLTLMDAESCRMLDWMKNGVYDALQKKYIKTLLLCMCKTIKGPKREECASYFSYWTINSQEVYMDTNRFGEKEQLRWIGLSPQRHDLVFKEDGHEYAQVLCMLRNGRFEAMCIDGTKRLCHIRGKMHKKVAITVGDIVLVGLGNYQDDNAYVTLKYMPDEARLLKAYGESLENMRLNEGIVGGLDEDDGFVLCAKLPRRTTRDYIYADPARDAETSLLIIWNIKCFGVLSVLNYQGADWCKFDNKTPIHNTSPGTISGCVCSIDVDIIVQAAGKGQSGNAIVDSYGTCEINLLPNNAAFHVRLKVVEYEYGTLRTRFSRKGRFVTGFWSRADT